MKAQLSPQQAILLLSMTFGATSEDREPQQSKTGLDAKPRDALVRAGLLSKEKRKTGRSAAQHLILTPQGREWVSENLDATLPVGPRTALVLSRVLRTLAPLLKKDPAQLRAMVGLPSSTRTSTTDANESSALESSITSAYFELTNGASRQRVLLRDLRPRVDAQREAVDRTLLSMQRERKLVLMQLDNASEITPADDAAALHIAGNPRHLLYFQG